MRFHISKHAESWLSSLLAYMESKCGQAEHAARMEPKRKPATEMEQSGIEVRSTAKVKEHAARHTAYHKQ